MVAIPKEFRKKVLSNVFCSKCSVTTIVDYSFTAEKDGIMICGKCKKYGEDVARYVEEI